MKTLFSLDQIGKMHKTKVSCVLRYQRVQGTKHMKPGS